MRAKKEILGIVDRCDSHLQTEGALMEQHSMGSPTKQTTQLQSDRSKDQAKIWRARQLLIDELQPIGSRGKVSYLKQKRIG